MRVALLLAVGFGLAISALAAGSCPFLNSATAGGILGRKLNLEVTHSGPKPENTTCDFNGQDTNATSLRITVRRMTNMPLEYVTWLQQCAEKTTPLKGIGNEAVECDANNGSQSGTEVLSRVRDQAFSVRVLARDVPLTESRRQARRIAELVSGNLF